MHTPTTPRAAAAATWHHTPLATPAIATVAATIAAIVAALGRPAAACAQDPAPRTGEPVRLTTADGAPIDLGTEVGHAGPLFADLDGDGRAELLVGSFAGRIAVFHDAGSGGATPRYTAAGPLRAVDGEAIRLHNW